MSRLCPIKPLLRQLCDNAYRASPALISGEPRELPYIALGAAHSLLQCMSPDVALRDVTNSRPDFRFSGTPVMQRTSSELYFNDNLRRCFKLVVLFRPKRS
jgi:hypothetical protein